MPKTYDEIVRALIPDPDSSFRPSEEQVKQAREGFRALDADEQALMQRVEVALSAHPNVKIEVERDRVILRGKVSSEEELRSIPEQVRKIDGVGAIDDELVIG